MNKVFKILGISILLLTNSCSDCPKVNILTFKCTDRKTCLEIENHLEIIHDFIFFSKGNVENVVNSGKFMEKISGHKSQTEMQFGGQDPPTMDDYYTWTAWYTENHSKLKQ